jgi:(E)-4-hydroxy-3-methylbut-2-enyl-diphosphate synthase
MVYGMGKTSHTVKTEEMVEHIVGLVEARAAAMKAAKEPEKPSAGARQAAE